MKLCDVFFYLLIPTLILLHLIVAPYTKVEESFNIQATHDILTYGVPLQDAQTKLQAHYDHFTFPSPVPRTFVGALVLAGLARPLAALELVDKQVLVRGILGLLNSAALLVFARSVSKSFGKTAGRWYLLFQASQFHIIYYASRTLPNMFAFGLVTLALAALLPFSNSNQPGSLSTSQKRSRLALYLLTISGVIFRGEIALLVATHTAYLYLFRRRLSLRGEIIPAGLSGLIVGLAVAVPIDSFFSQYFPTWAELAGFYFNAVQGKSSEWGTSPWWYYFLNALPRLLINPVTFSLCIPVALANISTRAPSLDLLIPNLAFVAIYSIQPHKEWRFIVYVVPALTAAASLGAAWIWNRRAKNIVYAALALGLVGSVLASFVASTAMLAISSLNYPGALALHRLHHLVASQHPSVTPVLREQTVKVHLDDLSTKTGITRFLQLPGPESFDSVVLPTFSDGHEQESSSSPSVSFQIAWIYDKSNDENDLLDPVFWTNFDYVLAEQPERVIGVWDKVDEIYGFAGLGLTRDNDIPEDEDIEKQAGHGTRVSSADSADSARETPSEARLGLRSRLRFSALIHQSLHKVETLLRTRVTRGYWIQIKMRPMIYILRRQTQIPDT